MSSLKDLVDDLRKPFSGMIATDAWYEGIDHVITIDTRTDDEIAAEVAQDEQNSRYVGD